MAIPLADRVVLLKCFADWIVQQRRTGHGCLVGNCGHRSDTDCIYNLLAEFIEEQKWTEPNQS